MRRLRGHNEVGSSRGQRAGGVCGNRPDGVPCGALSGADPPVRHRRLDTAFNVVYWLFIAAIFYWWGLAFADARNWRESYNPEDVPNPVAFDSR